MAHGARESNREEGSFSGRVAFVSNARNPLENLDAKHLIGLVIHLARLMELIQLIERHLAHDLIEQQQLHGPVDPAFLPQSL